MKNFMRDHTLAIILVAILTLEIAFMFLGAIFINSPKKEWVVCRPVPENTTVVGTYTVTKIEGGKVNYCYYVGDEKNPASGKFSISDEEFARLQIGDKATRVQYENNYWRNFFMLFDFILGIDAVIGFFGILSYALAAE